LITNPYCGECGHVYCYTCLIEEIANEEGDGWRCLRCGTLIKHVTRWEEVIEDDTVKEEETVNEEKEDVEGTEDKDTSQSDEILTPNTEDNLEEEVDSNDENLFSRS
jgi:peroxin-2